MQAAVSSNGTSTQLSSLPNKSSVRKFFSPHVGTIYRIAKARACIIYSDWI